MSGLDYVTIALHHLRKAMQSDDDQNTQLKAAIARLRRVASGQADIMAICTALEEYFGSPETHRAKLHPAWKGKLPPERGETR